MKLIVASIHKLLMQLIVVPVTSHWWHWQEWQYYDVDCCQCPQVTAGVDCCPYHRSHIRLIAVPVRVRDDLLRFNCKPGHNGLNSTDQLTPPSKRPGISSVIANSDYMPGPIVNEPYRYMWLYLRVHALIPMP